MTTHRFPISGEIVIPPSMPWAAWEQLARSIEFENHRLTNELWTNRRVDQNSIVVNVSDGIIHWRGEVLADWVEAKDRRHLDLP